MIMLLLHFSIMDCLAKIVSHTRYHDKTRAVTLKLHFQNFSLSIRTEINNRDSSKLFSFKGQRFLI